MMEVYEANYIGDAGMKSPLSAGYTMRFKRDFGGYPLVTCVEPAQNFQYGEGEDYAVNSRIGEEHMDIYVDETGVRYIAYSDPKEVLREENASVELLPFETIQERIRKSLTYGLSGIEKQAEVYRVVLTVNTQRVVNSDEFYEVPCWVVFYDTMRYSSFTLLNTWRRLRPECGRLTSSCSRRCTSTPLTARCSTLTTGIKGLPGVAAQADCPKST